MGPFPHQSKPASINADNPAGTDGFEFVEFAHPNPEELAKLFTKMGYSHVATHTTKKIDLWRQGDINYLVNAEPGTHATDFCDQHGPCASSMAWRVVDAQHAFKYALAHGATPHTDNNKALDVPAIKGIGGSLIYFIENYGEQQSAYENDFHWLIDDHQAPTGHGFYYLDHLTHNVHRGNMDVWWKFYRDLFGFKQIHFFDIEGKLTGLISRAITSPCGKIRIPLNESTDDNSQIEEYLHKYNGEGIQHIAVGCDNIYDGTDALANSGINFMPGPPDTYYDNSVQRVNGHEEPIERLKLHGILIDGEGVVGGGITRILLQIFSKTVIGPIFFEFIQRKGDEGFGEGNFRALFESIEADQIARGVLNDENAA